MRGEIDRSNPANREAATLEFKVYSIPRTITGEADDRAIDSECQVSGLRAGAADAGHSAGVVIRPVGRHPRPVAGTGLRPAGELKWPGCASSLIGGSTCGQMRAKSRPAF